MNKNKNVDTAKKGQTTNNIQPENVKKDLAKIQETKTAKKSKTPTGKVTLLKETEARKKAREKEYQNFRVNALRRRCKRMNISEEDTEEYVKKLIEQLSSPNSYKILIMFNKKDISLVREAIKKEGMVYNVMSDSHLMMDGDQETLATIRTIMPPSAKIYPYVSKKPCVIPVNVLKEAAKKPLKKAEKKASAAKAKASRKTKNLHFQKHKKRIKTLAAVRKHTKAIIVQMPTKKASEGSKTLKKAA